MNGATLTGAAAIQGPEVLVPIAFFAVTGFIGFSVTPIGRAIARRISGGVPDESVVREVQALKDDVAELRDESALLRRELTEAHERLDFAERLLAQAKEKGLLNAPRANA